MLPIHVRITVTSFVLSIASLCVVNPPLSRAQWTKDIDCPVDTVYRDVRKDAGRQEFCEHRLPGSLRVKDGPFRFWFSEDNPGSQGSYRDGREVGTWKECDRFGRCKQVVHELIFPMERGRNGSRRELPVSFQDGKYIFNFTSCWSTWMTQTSNEDLNLNVDGQSHYRCMISYIPEHVLDHGGEGAYECNVPFSVGRKEFDSIDLLHELPKAGLPQFCRTTGRTGESFMLEGKSGMVATTVDIVSALIKRDRQGREIVSFGLNPYATDIAMKEGPLVMRLCGKYAQQTRIVRDTNRHAMLNYRLSSKHLKASQEKDCIAKAIAPQTLVRQ